VDLSLDAPGLGQAGLVSLARLAPRLNNLKLNNRGEQPEDLDLGALSALTSLEVLDLDLEDCASIVAWFSSRPPRSLKYLSLTGFEDWDLLLSVLPWVPDLTGLSLCVNVFEGSGLEKVHMLAINKAQKLETLCLRNFSSDGLQHLRLPALRSLHLLDWSDDELDLSASAQFAPHAQARSPEPYLLLSAIDCRADRHSRPPCMHGRQVRPSRRRATSLGVSRNKNCISVKFISVKFLLET
jgi:hypothetical protein